MGAENVRAINLAMTHLGFFCLGAAWVFTWFVP